MWNYDSLLKSSQIYEIILPKNKLFICGKHDPSTEFIYEKYPMLAILNAHFRLFGKAHLNGHL